MSILVFGAGVVLGSVITMVGITVGWALHKTNDEYNMAKRGFEK